MAEQHVITPLPAPLSVAVYGDQVALRPWTRTDRSISERWPVPDLPVAWLDPGVVSGMRVSYAIMHWRVYQLVGRLTLRDLTPTSARIGIYLRSDLVGQGIGREALGLLARNLLIPGGLTTLWADVALLNQRARRCFARAGWQYAGSVQRGGLVFVELVRQVQHQAEVGA